MQLVRLELSGFKSFGKKTTITFNHPITGIVGPNGSGKSNVAEAIRFVLGEQSMKSMRGKLGTDLIFKGSEHMSPLGRASVTAFFDNKKNRNTHLTDGIFTYLQFDEIRITREIYADGANEYLVNDTKVRLKDIQELLSTVNIGNTGHHMISQGEADRVLTANIRERKEMLEDALGLKLYQYRIKEAERKLEKTQSHLHDGEIARREIAPHLGFLKRQVDKIEARKENIKDLVSMYQVYLSREDKQIQYEKSISKDKYSLEELLAQKQSVESQIEALEKTLLENSKTDSKEVQINIEQSKLSSYSESRLSSQTKVLRLEAEERVLVKSIDKAKVYEIEMSSRKTKVFIEKEKAESASKGIIGYIDQIKWRADKHDLAELPNLLVVLKQSSSTFFDELLGTTEDNPYIAQDSANMEVELLETKKALQEARVLYELSSNELENQEKVVLELKKSIEIERQTSHTEEKKVYENRVKKSELEGLISKTTLENSILKQKVERFEEEIQEAVAIVGNDILVYKNYIDDQGDNRLQSELYKKIERLKIKLEDAQVSNASDLMKEHEVITGRDEFLRCEIEDLLKTKKDLSDLIADLASNLDKEFTVGVQKINTQFTMFFTDMFSGGSAELFEVKKEKRLRRKNDDSLDIETSEENETETGIDVRVALPGKKVRDISMLSGGERALTSIALLFAISGVNPPPFMVLDETDAALDESNARRYGKSLKHLAKHSKLIVITHNRETMNQADALYGVTVGKDGSSKVLSVMFDEASEYAK